VKVKRQRTADCVVIGVTGDAARPSLVLGLLAFTPLADGRIRAALDSLGPLWTAFALHRAPAPHAA